MIRSRRGRIRTVWLVGAVGLSALLALGVIVSVRLFSPQEPSPQTEDEWKQLLSAAWKLSVQGRDKEAISAGERLVQSATRLFGEDDARVAQALWGLAEMHVQIDSRRARAEAGELMKLYTANSSEEAVRKFREESQKREKDPESTIRRLHQGELRGQELLKRELARRERRLGAQDVALVPFITALAQFYTARGADALAKALYERAVAICETSRGPRDRTTADALTQLANSHLQQDEVAIPLFARAIDIYLSLPGAEPEEAGILFDIWVIYHNNHRYSEAEDYGRLAVAVLERAPQALPKHLVNALGNLSSTYAAHGRYEQAEELYRRSLALQEQLDGGKPSHSLFFTLVGLRRVLRELGKYEEANQMDARAEQMRQQLYASRAADPH